MRHEEDNVETSISTLTNTIITLNFTQMFLFANNSSKQATEFLSAIIITKNKLIEERHKKSKLRYATLGIVKYIENEQKKARYAKLKRNALTGVVLRSFIGDAGIASGLVINGMQYLYYSYPELFAKVKTKVSGFFLKTTADNKVTLNFKNIALTGGTIGATVILVMYFYDSSLPSRWLFEGYSTRTALKKVPEVLPMVLQSIVENEDFQTTTGKGLIPFYSRYKFVLNGIISPLLQQVMAGNSIGYFLLSTLPFEKLSKGELNITPSNVKIVMNIFTQLFVQQAENQNLISKFSNILEETNLQKLDLSAKTFREAFALLTANNPTLSFVPVVLTNTLPFLTNINDPVKKATLVTDTIDGLVDGYLVRQAYKQRFKF